MMDPIIEEMYDTQRAGLALLVLKYIGGAILLGIMLGLTGLALVVLAHW